MMITAQNAATLRMPPPLPPKPYRVGSPLAAKNRVPIEIVARILFFCILPSAAKIRFPLTLLQNFFLLLKWLLVTKIAVPVEIVANMRFILA